MYSVTDEVVIIETFPDKAVHNKEGIISYIDNEGIIPIFIVKLNTPIPHTVLCFEEEIEKVNPMLENIKTLDGESTI